MGTTGILFDDFMRMQDIAKITYLKGIRAYYEHKMTIPDKWKDLWYNPYMIVHFIEDCKVMANNTKRANYTCIRSYDTVIFENGQGLALGDIGADSPEFTPSKTGCLYALEIIRELGDNVLNTTNVQLHYVSRTYLTRHGDGYLEYERPKNHVSAAISEDTANHYNENQGEFRYGEIDYEEVWKRVQRDAGALDYNLELTHCDEIYNAQEAAVYFPRIITNGSPLI